MLEVGIRGLKNQLSHYLALVRRGERIAVTDRGKIVAYINPAPGADLPPPLGQLIAEGRAIYAPGPVFLPDPAPVVAGDRTIADSIVEERDASLRRFERPGEAASD